MKRQSFTYLWWLALVAVLLAPAASLGAQEPVPAYRCNNYARDSSRPYCLLVPVEDGAGLPLPGAIVTAIYNGEPIQVRVGQTIDGPAGETIAAVPLEQIGAGPGAHIDLRVQASGEEVRQVMGFQPNPKTRTQQIEPVVVGDQAGPAAISGEVYLLDSPTPLTDYVVEIRQEGPTGKVLARIAGNGKTGFSFEPGTLPNGTLLWLKATSSVNNGVHVAIVPFRWENRALKLRVVLNWPCGEILPRGSGGPQLPRGSGGPQVPDPFCVVGTATLNGEPVAGASVSAEVLGALPGAIPGMTAQTKLITVPVMLDAPVFLLDIGSFNSPGLGSDAIVRFTATYGSLIGSVDLSLAELGMDSVWGITGVAIALHDEHSSGSGAEGGSPAVIAAVGDGVTRTLYSATRDGVLLWRGAKGSSWLPLLGNADTMLPSPEITALAGSPLSNQEDLLIAGLLSGNLARSTTSGRAWRTLPNPGVGKIRALALAGNQLYILGSSGAARIDDVLADAPTAQPIAAPASSSLAIAANATGQVFVGGPDGLFILQAVGWRKLRSEPINALALGASVSGDPALVVATAQGLFATDARGAAWLDLGLVGAATSIGAAQGDEQLWAVTADGLLLGQAEPAQNKPYSWSLDTPAERLTREGTLGAPTVFELVTSGGRTYAATSSGVAVSDDGGLNWKALNPSFTSEVRSLAVLPQNVVLALGRVGLFRLSQAGVTPIEGLPANLNPSVVRASPDGQVILVGRHGGPGPQLWARVGEGAWSILPVGRGSGVTDMAFFANPADGVEALIATESDGLFGYSRGATELRLFPSLANSNGRPLGIGSLWIDTASGCTILAGVSNPARVVARPCDTSSDWGSQQPLVGRDAPATTVQALTRAGDRLFAATESGFFQGQSTGGWQPVFGLPIRPRALAPSSRYNVDHTLITGGTQSGPILLFDATPDLAVSLQCPRRAIGDSSLSCTLSMINQGLLPVPAAKLTPVVDGLLTIASEAEISYPELTTGTPFSRTITLTVPRDVKPARTQLRVTAPTAPGEIFTLNNSDIAEIQLAYRDGPDPTLVIGGQTMAHPGEIATLRLAVSNAGSQPMNGAATLSVAVPPGLILVDVDGATVSASGQLQWQVPALAAGEQLVFTISYQLPPDPSVVASFTLGAQLIDHGDDREVGNNRDTAGVQPTPTEPLVVVLTNITRLARRGTVEQARAQLADYLKDAPGLELALDAAPLCAEARGGVACAYQAWDRANQKLLTAQNNGLPLETLKPLARQATEQRRALVQAIKLYVRKQLAQLNLQPRYLYIVGDDEVIPYGALRDGVDIDLRNNQEDRYAEEVNSDPTLYALFRSNYYPNAREYDRIGDVTFTSATRQPGSPAAIAAALELYNVSGGSLTISQGLLAGMATGLTEDGQLKLCAQMAAASLPMTTDCATVAEQVSDGLTPLEQPNGGKLASISGHAARDIIGDTSAARLGALNMQALNLLLLLGCHSGLTAGADDSTLVTELALQGQPAVGYLGYVYAGTLNDQEAIAYAEQLQLHLVQHLLAGNIELGQAFGAALKDYGPLTTNDLRNRHQKTIDTVALFGPPTYRIKWAKPTPPPVAEPAFGPGTLITLNPSYTSTTTADGTSYQAQTDVGEAFTMLDGGLPIQPAINIVAGPNVGGALIKSAIFSDATGVNPVILTDAPVATPYSYSESAYGGGTIDRPRMVGFYEDGDARPHIIVVAGQWSPRGNTQRLFNQIELELLPRLQGGRPASFGEPLTSCFSGKSVRVEVPAGANIARMEIVMSASNQLAVYPMRRIGKLWRVDIVAQPWSRYVIQAVGTDGSVAVDDNQGRAYLVPDEYITCGSACDVNTARDDLKLTFLADNQVRVTNTSLVCRHEASISSYRIQGDGTFAFYGEDHNKLRPGGTVTLNIEFPGCAAQVFVAIGRAIRKPLPVHYDDRLLTSKLTQTGRTCNR